ncbi:MAG: hypothetical protein Q9218_003965 [Villophora microphyllina]
MTNLHVMKSLFDTPATNKLLLRPCTTVDIPQLAILHNACFAGPRDRIWYRHVTPEDKIKYLESNLRRSFEPDATDSHPKSSHLLCVLDPSNNTIISYAIWIYYPHGYHPSADIQTHHSYLPPGMNENLTLELERKAAEIRSSHPGRHQAHWHLTTLCTHPEHEGRGAGSMLIRWGLEKADEMGARCFVEATARGLQLYKKRGFEDEVGVLNVDLRDYEEGEGMGMVRWVALMREPAMSTGDETVKDDVMNKSKK